jgi:hypothetical protein
MDIACHVIARCSNLPFLTSKAILKRGGEYHPRYWLDNDMARIIHQSLGQGLSVLQRLR